MVYQFGNHADYVAAAEQLADDMVDFRTNAKELTITVDTTPRKSTLNWLKKVTV